MSLEAPREPTGPWPARRLPVIALFLTALLARAWVFFNLDTVVYWWRPSDNAAIARNFFEHGYRLLYPQVDWGGAGSGYVEMEFPVLQYVTALLYGVFGFHESLALALPLAAALGSVVTTYWLGRELVGEWPARLASLVLAVSTSFIRYSETFLGEPLLVCMVTTGLYALLCWTRRSREEGYWLAAACVALAILIKPTALVIGLPVAYLVWERDGWRAFTQGRIWALAALMLVPAALWYWHAYRLGAATGNTVGILSSGYLKLARADLLTSAEFYLRQVWFVAMYHLTPVLLVPLAVGLCTLDRRARVISVWILAGLVQIVVAAEGNFASPYYQLVMLPALALTVGAGVAVLADRLRAAWPLQAPGLLVALGVVAVACQGATLWRSHHRSDFVTFGRAKARQARLVRDHLHPGSLIVYAALDRAESTLPPRGAHSTPPDIFYFSGLKGWFLALDWISVADIEARRASGARYFVVSEYWGGERAFLERERSDVWRHLVSRYPRVVDESGVLAFDLRASAGD